MMRKKPKCAQLPLQFKKLNYLADLILQYPRLGQILVNWEICLVFWLRFVRTKTNVFSDGSQNLILIDLSYLLLSLPYRLYGIVF